MAQAEKQQQNQAEMVEEFIMKESKTEFDAVHPRFVKPENLERVRRFQMENDYFCEQCRLFFAPTVEALKLHFKGDIVQHRPYGSCFYCKGAVYQYKFNQESLLYHKCVGNK